MSKLVIRAALALTALAMLIGMISDMRTWVAFVRNSDFMGYYTAAALVRSRMNLDIYGEDKRNVDPTEADADPNTTYARVARAHGIPEVSLYDYPPTLADLLVPLTFFSPFVALLLWETASLAALAAASLLLTRMLGGQSFVEIILVFLLVLIFRPTLSCLYWGQVSILLLLLLISGITLHERRMHCTAAFLFALAAAIKLTPLVVIIPFFAWRDWKTLRAFAFWSVAILGALVVVNGWGTLSFYFLHELPRIGAKLIDPENRSLGNVLQGFIIGFRATAPLISLVWVGRLFSILVLCYAGWLSRSRRGDNLQEGFKVEMIAIFLLISACLAPVSWVNSYVVGAPALIMVGKRMWEENSTIGEAALLSLFMISFAINRFPYLGMTTPLVGVALGIVGLQRLQRQTNLERVSGEAASGLL